MKKTVSWAELPKKEKYYITPISKITLFRNIAKQTKLDNKSVRLICRYMRIKI